jgi:5-methylcytosine-specific restriction endonuclease McrA
MHRTLHDLSPIEQTFIDSVYVKLKTFQEVAELLAVDRATITKMNLALEAKWKPIAATRKKWKTKEIEGNFWDFYFWHSTAEQKCHYCGVTQEELNELHQIGILNNRPTRGRTFEIDRKKPDEKYSNLENLAICCYWCNNAKTDTFTEDEFMNIGKAIGMVWKKRLGK